MALAHPGRPTAARHAFWRTGLAVYVLWNIGTLVGAARAPPRSATRRRSAWMPRSRRVPRPAVAAPGRPHDVGRRLAGAAVALLLTPVPAPGPARARRRPRRARRGRTDRAGAHDLGGRAGRVARLLPREADRVPAAEVGARERASVRRVAGLLPVAMLAALVAVQTFADRADPGDRCPPRRTRCRRDRPGPARAVPGRGPRRRGHGRRPPRRRGGVMNEPRKPVFGFLWPKPDPNAPVDGAYRQVRRVRVTAARTDPTRDPARRHGAVIAVTGASVMMAALTSVVSAATVIGAALARPRSSLMLRGWVVGTYVTDEAVTVETTWRRVTLPWTAVCAARPCAVPRALPGARPFPSRRRGRVVTPRTAERWRPTSTHCSPDLWLRAEAFDMARLRLERWRRSER